MHLHSLWLIWVPFGSLGLIFSPRFTWVNSGELRFTWFHLVSLVFSWVHMGSLGFTWGHLESLGFTLVHLASLELSLEKNTVLFGTSVDFSCMHAQSRFL